MTSSPNAPKQAIDALTGDDIRSTTRRLTEFPAITPDPRPVVRGFLWPAAPFSHFKPRKAEAQRQATR